jgi:hypothetical protein
MSGRWKRTQNTHGSNQWPTRAQKSSNFEATGPEDETRRHLSIATAKHFKKFNLMPLHLSWPPSGTCGFRKCHRE